MQNEYGLRFKHLEVSYKINHTLQLWRLFFIRISIGFREKRLALKSELQIRKKAMVNEEFPSKEIIDEFMQDPIDMTALQLGWFQPNTVKFVVSETEWTNACNFD